MKISVLAIKSKKNPLGESPIYARFSYQGDKIDFCTGVYVLFDYWCKQTKAIINHPKSKILNAQIKEFTDSLAHSFAFILDNDKEVTKQNLLRYLGNEHKKELNFNQLIELYTESILASETVKSGTKRAAISKMKCIRVVFQHLNYINRPISCFTPKKTYLFFNQLKAINTESPLAESTLNKYNQHLKRFFDFAIQHEYLSGVNPIIYVCPPPPPKEELNYLSPKEVSLLEEYKFRSFCLSKVRDLFLFQCYTGLAYVDLMAFRKDHIQLATNGVKYISIKRQKTGTQSISPVDDKAMALLNKYGQKMPVISNQKYNKYLKEIAEVIGIETRITSHTGRRTAGHAFLNAGMRIEHVSAILGHNSIKTTQDMYARITPDSVCEGFLRLNCA